MLLQTSYCLVYEFCFVCHMRNKTLYISHRFWSYFQRLTPAFVMLCLSFKALYPWTTKQVSLRFTCPIFWELFWNSRTKCPHIPHLLNHKSIKHSRTWFFCVSTVPESEEYKISIPWTLILTTKLLFLPLKMGGGGWGSIYTRVNRVMHTLRSEDLLFYSDLKDANFI